MLTQLIFRSSPPQINYFPENTEEQPKQYYLMREETSLFESILNTMKSSTSQSKKRLSSLISKMAETLIEANRDEIFWEHADRIVIDQLGLQFERDYTE